MQKWQIWTLACTVSAGALAPALGHDRYDGRKPPRWSESQEEFWEGYCRVKTESKAHEFKREIKCKNGVGASWGGEWKQEFRDGACKVTIDAKRDEYKEVIKCDD